MKVWEDKFLSLKTKLTLYKITVQSALLYGHDMGTAGTGDQQTTDFPNKMSTEIEGHYTA